MKYSLVMFIHRLQKKISINVLEITKTFEHLLIRRVLLLLTQS